MDFEKPDSTESPAEQEAKGIELGALKDINGHLIGAKQSFFERAKNTWPDISEEKLEDALIMTRLGGLIGRGSDRESLAKEIGVDEEILNQVAGSIGAAVPDRFRVMPSDETMEKIAAHFGTTVEELKS